MTNTGVCLTGDWSIPKQIKLNHYAQSILIFSLPSMQFEHRGFESIVGQAINSFRTINEPI